MYMYIQYIVPLYHNTPCITPFSKLKESVTTLYVRQLFFFRQYFEREDDLTLKPLLSIYIYS